MENFSVMKQVGAKFFMASRIYCITPPPPLSSLAYMTGQRRDRQGMEHGIIDPEWENFIS